VSGSVIGKRCVIGPGARVTDAYIFDDTVLGAGVVVARSIVGSRVSVGPRSVVPRGCLVGDGVVLGEDAQLRPFERVGTQPPGGDDDDSDQEEEGPDEASERRNRREMCTALMRMRLQRSSRCSGRARTRTCGPADRSATTTNSTSTRRTRTTG
jgi:UDP-3-O-[3-hydroxymyristoyl] glucosamine N-acyltransferase